MKIVLLSFDIEEFDMPLEYGKELPLEQQILVSTEGTRIILDLLQSHSIRATFFSTVIFAQHAPGLIARIGKEGHELASHGFFHSSFENEHLKLSKNSLEQISGKHINGFRMPRMGAVDNESLEQAGYNYNSSLNPVYLPGRYNHFFEPRTLFKTGGLTHLPASATPVIRFPLFWLSFHNLPAWIYRIACRITMNKDHYLNIYFHPWEFVSLTNPAYGLPGYVSKNSGAEMIRRFNSWITWMKGEGYKFTTIANFLLSKSAEVYHLDS
jgi:hypothetical protein